ncbi:MAG: ATP-binding protein [Pseudomonadota bacterium]
MILERNEHAARIGLFSGMTVSETELPPDWSHDGMHAILRQSGAPLIAWQGDDAHNPSLFELISFPCENGTCVLFMDRTEINTAFRTGARSQDDTGTDQTLQFLATMSHEMRTPLNGILGMSDLLLDTDLDLNQRNFAQNLRQSGVALLDLINAIIDYAKLDTGRMKLSSEPFDLATLAETVTELLATKASTKDLELATLIHPNLPRRLRGDVSKVRQLLINLIGNAVKFTEEGGVLIALEAKSIEGKTCLLQIDVIDTGVGIPRSVLPNIFEAYARAETMERRSVEGTGLGLAIVKQLTDKMDGTIEVQSEEARGSTFSLRLPFELEEGAPKAEPLHSVHNRAVVLTENTVLARVTSLRLQAHGVSQFDICRSAEEAQRTLEGGEPALFLCDFPFADQCTSLITLAERAIVLIPASGRAAFETLKEDGFAAYLTKPIRQRSFSRVLSGQDLNEPEIDEPTTEIASGPEYGPYNILLAEDNDINAVLARAVVERGGHTLQVVGDGAAAVEAVKIKTYDIVLMDMHMPKMGGLEAARKIRAHERTGRIPIIALTANALQEDQEACFAAGMDDFLSKPFEPKALIAMINRYASGEVSSGKAAAKFAAK